jgi:hypothetical protein
MPRAFSQRDGHIVRKSSKRAIDGCTTQENWPWRWGVICNPHSGPPRHHGHITNEIQYTICMLPHRLACGVWAACRATHWHVGNVSTSQHLPCWSRSAASRLQPRTGAWLYPANSWNRLYAGKTSHTADKHAHLSHTHYGPQLFATTHVHPQIPHTQAKATNLRGSTLAPMTNKI